MGCIGSYNWQIRQKVGSMTLLTISSAVLVFDQKERVCLVKPYSANKLTIPGGYAEIGDSYKTLTIRELLEEAGLLVQKQDLELFATLSGEKSACEYNDGKNQVFTLLFVAKKWEYDDSQRDDEIEKIEWFEMKYILESDEVDEYTKKIIKAYQKYQKTKQVQMIEEF